MKTLDSYGRSSVRREGLTRAIGFVQDTASERVKYDRPEAQRGSLAAYADQYGLTLEVISETGAWRAVPTSRPALQDAMARLDAGDAEVLVATRLNAVAQSLSELADVLERARDNDWVVVLLDLGDTSTAVGRRTASIIASAVRYQCSLSTLLADDAGS